MNFPLGGNAVSAALIQHLWQSTLVCAALWILSLMLRRNAARIRFRLWVLASVKFLLPFSWLIAVGGGFSKSGTQAPNIEPILSIVIEGPVEQTAPKLHVEAPAENVTVHSVTATTRTNKKSAVPLVLALLWERA